MVIVVFIVAIIAVMFLGGLWIRWQRSRLQADRNRRLSIADGDFSALEPSSVQANIFKRLQNRWRLRRKRALRRRDLKGQIPERFKGFGRTAVPPLPTLTQVETYARQTVAPAAAEALAAFASYRDAVESALLVQQEYRDSVHGQSVAQDQLSQSIEHGDPEQALQELMHAELRLRQIHRRFALASSPVGQLLDKHKGKEGILQSVLHHLSEMEAKMDAVQEELSDEYRKIKIIAWSILNDCQSYFKRLREEVPPLPPEPSQAESEADALAARAFSSLPDLLNATCDLHAVCKLVQGTCREIEELRAALDAVPAPDRPTEQAVQAMQDQLFACAESLVRKKIALAELKPSIMQAQSKFEPAFEAVSVQLNQLAAQRQARANVPAKSNGEFKHWQRYIGSGETEDLRADSVAIKLAPLSNPLNLSDGAEAKLAAATVVLGIASNLLLGGASRCRLACTDADVAIARTRAASQQEQAYCDNLRAKSRKLAFALGQLNTSSAKLLAARNQPPAKRELRPPDPEDSNLDKYIRMHHKWCEDKVANAEAAAKHTAKIKELSTQESEREQQKLQAALQVGIIAHTLPQQSSGRTPDVIACLHVANCLFNRYGKREMLQAAIDARQNSGETVSS